jgi:hypothetical protein
MTLHVDVVKNEWLAGFQHPVARVFLRSGALDVESPDPERWFSFLRESVGDIDPTRDAMEFLAALPHNIQGTYIFATEPHDEDQCPYHDHPVVPIESRLAERPRLAEA